MAAVSLGPRLKRFSKDENGKNVTHAIPGHSTTLAVLGVFILWFAW